MGYPFAMFSLRVVVFVSLVLLGPPEQGIALAGERRSNSVEDDDLPSRDELRKLVKEGRIRPLSVLKAQVLKKLPGELIDIRVDREVGRIVYEFRILRDSGRVTEVEVEAASGRIIEVENE